MARAAIAWYVRLKDPTATNADRVAFHTWVNAAPEHADAFHDAEQLWQRLEYPARALGTGGWYRPDGRRHVTLPVLVAAALVILCVALVWWRDAGIVARAFADYATFPGTHQDTTLPDGTHVYLDGDSAITVTMDQTQRTVRLVRGRVWFEVPTDHPTGFRVLSGTVETRVLGASTTAASSYV